MFDVQKRIDYCPLRLYLCGIMKDGRSAWEKAKEYGVDTTLLEVNLKKTPTERVLALQSALALALELRQAGVRYYAKLRKARKTITR